MNNRTGCLQSPIIILAWSFDFNTDNLHVRKEYLFSHPKTRMGITCAAVSPMSLAKPEEQDSRTYSDRDVTFTAFAH